MNQEDTIRYAMDQLIGQGNMDAVESFFTADYNAHAEDRVYKGHEFIKRYSRQLRSAIPDIQVLKIEFLCHTGNTIAWQRTFHGTHKANMMGIPPSDKKIKWIEMVVTRFEGDRIAEEWVVSELAGQLLLKLPGKGKK